MIESIVKSNLRSEKIGYWHKSGPYVVFYPSLRWFCCPYPGVKFGPVAWVSDYPPEGT